MYSRSKAVRRPSSSKVVHDLQRLRYLAWSDAERLFACGLVCQAAWEAYCYLWHNASARNGSSPAPWGYREPGVGTSRRGIFGRNIKKGGHNES